MSMQDRRSMREGSGHVSHQQSLEEKVPILTQDVF